MRKLALTLVPLGLLLMMAGLRVDDLQGARRDTLDAAEMRASNLARVTSAYLAESFAATDTMLRQLVLHSRRVGGPAAAPDEWLPILAAARAGLPIGAVTVLDVQGIIRHSTQPAIVGGSRRNDPAFRDALRDPQALVIGTPFPTIDPGRSSSRYIIPVARALTDAQGRAVGTITASYVPEALRPFLQSIDVGREGFVWVFHPSGVVLYQEPSTRDVTGLHAEDHPVFVAARQRSAGLLYAPVVTDGPPKLTAYETRQNPPFVTAVSLDQAEVLAPWRREATRSAVLFGVLSVLLVGVLAVLLREMAGRNAALEREQRARAEAEHANALKDQFLMTLSHELRTPLTAIRGWARILSLDAVDDQRRGKAVEAIERNSLAQERLIEDLLDVSRVMAGKLPLNIGRVSVAHVAQLALDTVRPAAEAKNLRLRGAIDLGAGDVSGDAERLQQVIWNLLSNAVKFTPAGGRVMLEVRRNGSAVEVIVSDDGIGISPRFLPHVFERFRQEDATTTREHGGLGLGLAIVRSLVELHGGAVRAESAGAGKGATLTVTLPLLAAERAPDAAVAGASLLPQP